MWSTLQRVIAGITPLLAIIKRSNSRLFGLVFLGWFLAYSCAETARAQPKPQLPEPISTQPTPQEIATEILHRALHEAVWGAPAHCAVRQRIVLNDHQLSGFGKFVRAGQGSGKLKLSLQFPAGDAMNTLLQVSDGQRLHTLEDIGDVRKRTTVDLDKVRKRLIINNQSIYDATTAMYLAVGGQAESLRKLCQQYEWYEVRAGNQGETPVWLLSGRIAQIPPKIRAYADTDAALQLSSGSGLLPTTARLTIGMADSPLPYWLYQVEQRRTKKEVSQMNLTAKLRLITEWADPVPITQVIGDDYFEAKTGNDPFSDETEKYLPPAPNVAMHPSAQENF